MTYIPDCRTDEVYNESNLNDRDKEFVKGFDFCAETSSIFLTTLMCMKMN